MVGCHRCGGRSRSGARYCGACGTLLGSARPGVRKTVTVLFVEVSAPGTADLETGVRQATACHDALVQVLREHGGTVERPSGDAVMAVFGVPASRDDDARRAAAAALALLGAALPGAPVLSIGINTGEVLTGRPDDDQELAVGDAVVVAARLQQLAGPGEVLLGPATVPMLGPGARVGAPRSVVLRGRVGELPVVPLLGLDPDPVQGPRGPFVGREAERGLLLAALDRTVRGGLSQLVTVLGEAGTGKSRLVREVLAERGGAVRVLRGTCRGYGGNLTWAPLVEVVCELLGLPLGSAEEVLLQAATEQRPELTSGLPVLATMLGRGDTPVGGGELAAVVSRVLADLAHEQPMVVVLEDAHLAEPPLLELVDDVLRRLEQVPVLAVVTARPELLEHRAGWARGLRHALGLTLRPLAEEPARRLAEHLLPDDPEGAAALLGPAAGNPLFLEQLAQARAEGTEGPTASVSAVLAARLDRLPMEARQVLERAAVIGSRGLVADLVPLCGEQDIDLDAELAVLARRDLLEVGGPQWAFTSELVREVAAAGLTRADRAHLHQVRGLVVAAAGADAAAGFHFEQASRLLRAVDPEGSAGMARQAAARLAMAGSRALTGDLLAAADLLGRATALMPDDDPARLALLPDLARALMLAGDLAASGAVVQEALEGAERLGLQSVAAHAQLARLDLLRSTEPERAYDELPRVLTRVLPVLASSGDDRGLSLAHQLQAGALQYRVHWDAMELPLARAVRHAELAGDRRLLELAQSLQVGSMFHGPLHLDEARPRLEAMLRAPGASPSHRASVEARLAGTLALQGDPVAGRDLLTRVRRDFRDLGRELSALATAFVGGPLELLAGRPDAAVAVLQEACDGLDRLGDRAFTSTLAALLAEACWQCGDRTGAAAAVELSRERAGAGDVISQVRWRSVQAKLAAADGRSAEALQLAGEAVQRVASTDELVSQGDVLASAAEVHGLLDDPAAEQALLRQALERYERKGATLAVRVLAPRLLVTPAPALVVPQRGPADEPVPDPGLA